MRARRSLLAALAVVGTLIVPAAGRAAAPPPDFTYVTMADGIKIAISIGYPDGFQSTDVDEWPVLFQMDGYGGGADVVDPSRFGNNYVTVYASVRGTGCSGGRFDLFDERHREDGWEIIRWLDVGLSTNHTRPAQPKPAWSNGDVGIIGHSYPGLTGWLVASTNPANLKAVAISGLIDDLYRGIVYPGGVPNFGFPAFWTALARPALELQGNEDRYRNETLSGDTTCAANIAKRPPRDVLDDPVLQGATSLEDDTWWAMRSLITWLDGIRKPIHITQQYQDEQTGPRGGHVLFERIPSTVPKRLVITNGVHSTTAVGHADRVKWLDCYVRGVCVGDINDPTKRVRVHLETRHGNVTNAPHISSGFPLPETQWKRYHLCADGSLDDTPDASCDGTRSYASLPEGRQATEVIGFAGPDGDGGLGQATFAKGLPDELIYEVPFGADTPVIGPINLTLHADSTAPVTDFFVDVIDVDANGNHSYLQRGLQRSSHRAIDDLKSDFVASGPEVGSYYRAHHPHTNTTGPEALLVPGQSAKLEVEVFPIGHVFRAGHKLQIRLHAPPPKDPLSIYAWVSGLPPAVNTVHHDAMRPSSILIPTVPTAAVPANAPACGDMVGIPCFKPVS